MFLAAPSLAHGQRPTSVRPTTAVASTVNLVITDSTVRVPMAITSGHVTIRLTNRGRGPHQLQFLRLAQGRDTAEARAFLIANHAMPSWATSVGGIGPVLPGETVTATALMAPGDYLMVDGLPAPNGVPYFQNGVEATTRTTGAPTRDLPNLPATHGILITDRYARFGNLQRSGTTYRLMENRDRITSVERGDLTVRVEAMGSVTHGLVLLRGDPADIRAYVRWASGRGNAPVIVSGIPVLTPGSRAFLQLRLRAGSYVAFCPVVHARTGMRGFETGEFVQFVAQ